MMLQLWCDIPSLTWKQMCDSIRILLAATLGDKHLHHYASCQNNWMPCSEAVCHFISCSGDDDSLTCSELNLL